MWLILVFFDVQNNKTHWRAKVNNTQSLLLLVLLINLFFATSNSLAQEQTDKASSKAVPATEVTWTPLNPARGDKSPRAATLWGDRNGSEPTGFLVRFVDGFSSPPHIHNVTYRGVVIGGNVHNDDPDAKPMWMPPASFWTQPAGDVHVTAARGNTTAYIEIDNGPYLVLPTEEAFDNGERPVNVDTSNMVWLDGSNTSWIGHTEKTAAAKGAKISFLWGSPQHNHLNGTLVTLPTLFSGKIRSHGSSLRAVVIQGKLTYQVRDETAGKTMTPGSYFSSQGEMAHQVSCDGTDDCIIYVRSKGTFNVIRE